MSDMGSRDELSLRPEAIRAWIGDSSLWPTADSYDPDSLEPCDALARREAALRAQVPAWFWEGEPGASILSIGTGKGYFERKYWRRFAHIYVVDPMARTRRSLEVLPIANASFVGPSLFHVPPRAVPGAKYAWLGASIHYVFAEFYGWAFLRKLAMMVSDTLVIDGAVFDHDSPQGQYLLGVWAKQETGGEPFEARRRAEFSYVRFRESLTGLWDVTGEWDTSWIDDGRRTVVLKRRLPPPIQRDTLGQRELVVARTDKYRDNWSVFRTAEGYYKEIEDIAPLLSYDAVGKMMGWPDFVRWTVYDGDRFVGFVVRDYGEQRPGDPAVSEQMLTALTTRCLPLGFLPSDVARENIRIHDGRPVWIDVEFLALDEFDAFLAVWATTNTYKQYGQLPPHVDPGLLA